MLRGCSCEALLSDVRFVRVDAQCLWLGVLAGQWSLIRQDSLHPQFSISGVCPEFLIKIQGVAHIVLGM